MKKKLFLVIAFIFWTACCLAQSKPVLEIISPASGTTVSPGQTITISVSADSSISNIAILTQDPLDNAPPVGNLQFSLTIAADTPIRKYRVTAVGVASGKQEPIFSSPIYLYVEPLQAPVTIKPEDPIETFRAVGVSLPISVIGSFSDGSQVRLTRSSRTVYSSTAPTVATVDSQGLVTATGIGQADIMITNGTASCSVHVVVQRPVCGIRGEGSTSSGKRSNKGVFSIFVTTGPVAIAAGTVKYSLADTGMNFVAREFTAASISGNTGTVAGVGNVNGTTGYKFTITLVDKPHDTFSIQIYNPDGRLYYSAGPERIKEGYLEVICRDQGKKKKPKGDQKSEDLEK